MDKLKRFYKNFMRIMDYMGVREISAIAAATAFWLFLSLVPMVILAVSILPYTTLGEAQLMAFLSPILPNSLKELIGIIISDVYRSNLTILSVSILATVWSSSRGFSSLIWGLEEIYATDRRAGYFTRRLRGMVYTAGMLLFALLSIVLGGFGGQIVRLVERFFPSTHGFFLFLLNFRFLVVIAMLTLFFAGIYARAGLKPLPVKEVLPGAVFAAVCWSMLSWVFSVWVSLGSFGTYGSLATVVVVMLWLYFSQYLLLLGACFNRAIPRGLPRIQQRMSERQSARAEKRRTSE